MSKPLETATAPAPPMSITASYQKRLMVAAGRASRELGGKIAENLGVSEDEIKRHETDVQKATDQFIAEIDQMLGAKEKEVMSV